MAFIPEAEILKRTLALGHDRPSAVVLAHIAFFEQFEGGVEIGGQLWRYRSVREIGADVGYSDRTVTRAISQLVKASCILRKTIWDPRLSGKRVNAYRLMPCVERLLDIEVDAVSGRRARKGQHGATDSAGKAQTKGPASRLRNRQNDAIMYREHDKERNIELITLPAPERENMFDRLDWDVLQERVLLTHFDKYHELIVRGEEIGTKLASAFWEGLEAMYFEIADDLIEPFDQTICGMSIGVGY